MTKAQLSKALIVARKIVAKEIADQAAHGGRFAGGLSVEGYAGGYRQALDDVLFLLGPSCTPEMLVHSRYWDHYREFAGK